MGGSVKARDPHLEDYVDLSGLALEQPFGHTLRSKPPLVSYVARHVISYGTGWFMAHMAGHGEVEWIEVLGELCGRSGLVVEGLMCGEGDDGLRGCWQGLHGHVS